VRVVTPVLQPMAKGKNFNCQHAVWNKGQSPFQNETDASDRLVYRLIWFSWS